MPGKHCPGRGVRGGPGRAGPASGPLRPRLAQRRAARRAANLAARREAAPPLSRSGAAQSGCGLTATVPGRPGAEPRVTLSSLQRGAASSPTRVRGRTLTTGRRWVSDRGSRGKRGPARPARPRTKAPLQQAGRGQGPPSGPALAQPKLGEARGAPP